MYYLMDARAGFAAMGGGNALASDAKVLASGTAAECCDYANAGDYGPDCVVVNEDGKVMFEWYATGEWIPPDDEEQAVPA